MNIAIFHHHLNRGGVTSVIKNQIAAFVESLPCGANLRIALFHGGRSSGVPQEFGTSFASKPIPQIQIPNLEYDTLRNAPDNEGRLGQQIEAELSQLSFTPEETVLHFHNHSLGKNRELVPALHALASSGYRILLQIHDMAEDFRAENFAIISKELGSQGLDVAHSYPLASQIRYSVINRRDKNILIRAGIAEDSIHYLPNSLSTTKRHLDSHQAKVEFATRNQCDVETPLYLYPVRGIRRKNLGEAILLTAISPDPIRLGLTLCPNNDIEKSSYQGWKRLVQQLRLPVIFELGHQDGVSLEDNIAAADKILTTSVAEGFGLVFLESFANDKWLVGRDIPEITADFKEVGIQLNGLYSELKIPIELINLADFHKELHDSLERTYTSFDRAFDHEQLDHYIFEKVDLGWIDFAKLPVQQQRVLIVSAVRDPRIREKIRDQNFDAIEAIFGNQPSDKTKTIQQNQTVIQDHFCNETIGQHLQNIYSELIHCKPSNEITCVPDHPSILESFLRVDNFHPVRVECCPIYDIPEEEVKTLLKIIQSTLRPIDPVPTEVEPKLRKLSNIKAVVFDIYGTLLVSSSGDVGTDPAFLHDGRTQHPFLEKLLSEYELDLPTALQHLKAQIQAEHQQLRDSGIPYPEIEICEIWQAVLRQAHLGLFPEEDRADLVISNACSELREIALRAELLTNPVWMMPGFESCLNFISNLEIPMGIISNAQFYTPLILESLLNKSLIEQGFLPSLNHFSYLIGRAKPDEFLYKLAADSLRHHGISPDQVLYVGNDMTKDIVPAKANGFRTGLFAGDKRSLRCGQNGDPHLHEAVDLIFTELSQIESVFR